MNGCAGAQGVWVEVGEGGRRRAVVALGERRMEPLSAGGRGQQPRGGAPQVGEELGRTRPHLEVGRRVLEGQRRAGLAKRTTSPSLCSACIYVHPAWLPGRGTCLSVPQLWTHPALSSS